MSMHEWYQVMYGVELPNVNPSSDTIMEFVNKHADVFVNVYQDYKFPMSKDDAVVFAEEYEDDMGNYGTNAMIGDVIKNQFISVTVSADNYCYVGIFASNTLPWHNTNNEWFKITEQEVQDTIKPVVEELYGECPEFSEHTIWYWG